MARLRLRADKLDWVKAGDEEIILDSDREQYLATNPTGALLWERLAEGADKADLVAALLEHFDDLDPERAADDVDAFLDQLRDLDLLEEG